MKKIYLIILALAVIFIASILLFSKGRAQKTLQTTKTTPQNETQKQTEDEALKNALNLYAQKKSAGVDLSQGPCLGTVAPDWVADIAHNPRQTIDDKNENQCEDFRQGKARHFIELDPEGKLIRMQ